MEGALPQDPRAGEQWWSHPPDCPLDPGACVRTATFDLPLRLSAKMTPKLISEDEDRFALIAEHLHRELKTLESRIAELRRSPAASGEAALSRDTLIHRLSAQLRMLGRFDLDMCLGRMVFADSGDIVYIGRMGLRDADGNPLLVDWRTPKAEPFFAATLASPLGLSTRRRYRWSNGRITDYWDEGFASAHTGHTRTTALDDQAAFIASLGSSRSTKMHDVLSTIQADQDAIIRATNRTPLVVDGGPGTGKTVVALHRAAYLLYAHPRISSGGGLLFVGPNPAYLAYVDDVLPRLGEDGVQLCALTDMVPEATDAAENRDTARIKGSLDPFAVIAEAVRIYEDPPTEVLPVDTAWGPVSVGAAEWAEAFASVDPEVDHNSARSQVWNELLSILVDIVIDGDEEAEPGQVRRFLAQETDLREALAMAWPLLDPLDIVGDLWTVPDYLAMAAPELNDDEVMRLQRCAPRAWTHADAPLIDAARRIIGDPGGPGRKQRADAQATAERERMGAVIDELIAADDSELQQMTMLSGEDLRGALENPGGRELLSPDRLSGPFGHIIVDEAQELTTAQWHMLLNRCPSKSFTIVGDRAQARHGFAEPWSDRLSKLGLDTTEVHLSINYRTPAEVMAAAEPVIRSVLPQANVPRSVRGTGVSVRHSSVSELESILTTWLATHTDGTACVMAANPCDYAGWSSERVSVMKPKDAKGLEFDLVVLVEPESFGSDIQGGVDRYVAMTRATAELVVLAG